MDREWMAGRLPEKPPRELETWAKLYLTEEIGPEYLIFHAERVPVLPDYGEIMERNSMAPVRKEWAAWCSCTACNEDFYTQKVTGLDAIRLAVGEDGVPYTMDPGETSADAVDYLSGETLYCPNCGCQVELIHSRYLRGGRTKRVKVQAVQNVEGYTTVFYWMAVRRISEEGYSFFYLEPMDGYVLSEKGTLARFTHARGNTFGTYTQYGAWHPVQGCKDTHDSVYQDWGSTFGRKMGSYLYDPCPELGGCTGEKTGLRKYMEAGGRNLVQYLKFWRTHRNIENLVKAGQGALVAGIFRKASSYCYSVEKEMEKYVDLRERKPNRMLGISKEEFRQIRERGIQLKPDHLDLFRDYCRQGGTLKLPEFLDAACDFGQPGLRAAVNIMMQSRGTDLPKIARYLAKQNLRPDEVQHLVDIRRMAANLFPHRELTEEELWPRNLLAAHDRLVRIQEEQRRLRNQKELEEQDRQFREVLENYSALQWNDGELCILLPESAGDLHREGNVLRHCVGGYAHRHISGSDTIFFVRHYRRPERCYYTLDIRMNDGEPKEVQLHGYGNERHGKHKEHVHSIPKKVRDFVDRWKREVLLPWYYSQNKLEQKEKIA